MGSGRGTDGTLEGAELGDGFPSEGCSLHKGSRTEELKGGPRPIQSQAGAQKGFPAPHPTCSLVKAEAGPRGPRAGRQLPPPQRQTHSILRGPVTPPKLL